MQWAAALFAFHISAESLAVQNPNGRPTAYLQDLNFTKDTSSLIS
jgi:hypothetical protein